MLLNSMESNKSTLGFKSYCPCTPYRVLLPIRGEKAGQKEKSNSAFYKKVLKCVANCTGQLHIYAKGWSWIVGWGPRFSLTAHDTTCTDNLGPFLFPSALHWTNTANTDCWDPTQPASADFVSTTQVWVPRMWFESCWQDKVWRLWRITAFP